MLQICTSDSQMTVTVSVLHGFSGGTPERLCALRAAPELIVMKVYSEAPGVMLSVRNPSHSCWEEDIIL